MFSTEEKPGLIISYPSIDIPSVSLLSAELCELMWSAGLKMVLYNE